MADEQESALARLRRLEGGSPSRRPSGAPGPAGPGPAPRHRGIVGGIGAVLLAILLKGKWLLLILVTKGKLLLGALKAGPLLTTLSTMGLSVIVYAGFYGAKLALGFVLLILVHELGHGLVAKKLGLKVGAPVFIPLFGAVIALKEQPRTTWVDCLVGFGGPFAGLAGCVACLGGSFLAGPGRFAEMLVVLAWLTASINLFNMIPVFGLDGDRISQPFQPWYWVPGGVFLAALAAVGVQVTDSVDPFLCMILLLGAVKGIRLSLARRRPPPKQRLVDKVAASGAPAKYRDEETVQTWQRRASAALYFGLVGGLAALVFAGKTLLPAVRS